MEWLKLHDEFVNDPKMRRYFSKAEQCDWIRLLCLASKSRERGVVLLPDDEISFALEQSDEEWLAFAVKLSERRMVHRREDGALVIENWERRQYDKPSDTPARVSERVARHRAKKAGVTDVTRYEDTRCNAPVTPCNTLEERRGEENKDSPLTPRSRGESANGSALVEDGDDCTRTDATEPDKPLTASRKSGESSGRRRAGGGGSGRSSGPPAAICALMAAFRRARYGPSAPEFTDSEYGAFKVNYERLTHDGYTPAQVVTATEAALRRWESPGMVNPRSVARHIDNLLEPDPPPGITGNGRAVGDAQKPIDRPEYVPPF